MSGPYHGLPPLRFLDTTRTTPSRDAVRFVRDSLVSQRDALAAQVVSANALLNSLAPINRLPDELLIMVFLELRNLRPPCPTHIWSEATGICRAWKAISTATPQLWTDLWIGDRTSSRLFRSFLERSGPLTISVSFMSTVIDPIEYFTPLRAHRARVRVLQFGPDMSRQCSAAVHHFLSWEVMPALETLSVMFYTNPPRLFKNTASPQPNQSALFTWYPQVENHPRIREISLGAVALGQYAILGPSVTRVELRDCLGDSASLNDLVGFLRNCVALEDLTIHRYRFREDASDVDPELRVSLPAQLRKLVLHNHPFHILLVLRMLVVPATADVSITTVSEGDHRSVNDPIHRCLPADRSCLPILSMVSHVRVELRSEDCERPRELCVCQCTITGTAGSHSISIAASPPDSHSIVKTLVEDLVSLFADAPVVELVIIGANEHLKITTARWKHALSRFRRLERLLAMSPSSLGPQVSLLNALKGGDSVLCPNMRELALSSLSNTTFGPKLLHAVTECLRDRQARGQRLTKLHMRRTSYTWRSQHRSPDSPPRVKYITEREVRWRDTLMHLAESIEFGDFSFGFGHDQED